MDNLPLSLPSNRKRVPEPTWDGTAATVRQFIRNFTWVCKRHDFPPSYYVHEIMSYVPSSEFEIWESVAQDYPNWDEFVKSILGYYPQPSRADSSSRLSDLTYKFRISHNTSNKDIFFSYLRQFTIALNALELHWTVSKSEKVAGFSEGLKPIVHALIDKHNPQDMNGVIAVSAAVFDYLASFDSERREFFDELVESFDLKKCQESDIV
ncbi:hypothetical protein FA15DRAFT_660622 [Coprinopsis marcescibilis]|uniref:Retrotransposon gag domain-containing protein n=1 Tax=Coprinopsis marcescibilis TaxID=230819 RepID=A0A5C3KER2_COPMA|nr:hypothetical protein FA15DRAFT_660622 [Coprinopsis marcescibilis]